MEAELQTIQTLVSGATLSPEVRRNVVWRLVLLPPIYRDLERSFDSRYRDTILRLVDSMLKTLAAKDADSPDGSQVGEGIVHGLLAMHARLGISSLGLKLPAPPKPVKAARKRKV